MFKSKWLILIIVLMVGTIGLTACGDDATSTVGAACTTDADCSTGEACVANDAGDKVCTASSGTACTSDADCTVAGETCLNIDATSGEGACGVTPCTSVTIGSDAVDSCSLTPDLMEGGWVWNDWADTSASATRSATNPAAPAAGTVSGDNTLYKCKMCHGWDGLGLDGGYGGHSTGVKAIDANANLDSRRGTITLDQLVAHGTVAAVDLATAGDLMDINSELTGQQIVDVLDFLNNGDKISDVADVSVAAGTTSYTWLAPDKAFGETTYDSVCITCHGMNGVKTPPGGSAHVVGVGGGLDGLSGIAGYLMDGSGKRSEEWHKIVYGENDVMNPAAVGLTGDEAAKVVEYVYGEIGIYAEICTKRFFSDDYDFNTGTPVPGVQTSTGTWDAAAACADTTNYPAFLP